MQKELTGEKAKQAQDSTAIIQSNLRILFPQGIKSFDFRGEVPGTKVYDAKRTVNLSGVPVKLYFVLNVGTKGTKKQVKMHLAHDPNQEASCTINLNAFGGFKGSQITFAPQGSQKNVFQYVLENYGSKVNQNDSQFKYLQSLRENATLLEMKFKMPEFKTKRGKPAGKSFFVNQDKARISRNPLITYGLTSCTATAFTYSGKNFLFHADAGTNPAALAKIISKNFDVGKLKKDQNFKVYMFSGGINSDGSYLAVMKAMKKLGLESKVHIASQEITFDQTVGISSSGPFMYSK